MKKRNKAASLFIGILRFILIVVMAASLFIATISTFMNSTLLNEGFYRNQLTSDKYINEIKLYINKAIKSSCLYYGLPYDSIEATITEDSIKKVSEQYAEELYKSLKSGGEMSEIVYPEKDIKAVLDKFFEEEKIDIDEQTVQLITQDLAGTVSANIVALKDSYGSINILKPMSKYIFSNKYVQLASKYSIWILPICIILTVLSLLLCASNMHKRLYTVANVYWLAGCIMFIPSLFFNNHDILSKIALTDSPVKSFVNTVGNSMIHNLLKITTVLFVISCVFIVLAFIAYIASVIKRRRADKNNNADVIDDLEDDTDIDEDDNDDDDDLKDDESDNADEVDDNLSDKDIDDIVNEIYKEK